MKRTAECLPACGRYPTPRPDAPARPRPAARPQPTRLRAKFLHTSGDLVRVHLDTIPVVFVTSAELAHAVMVTHRPRCEKGRLLGRCARWWATAWPPPTAPSPADTGTDS